MRDALALLLAAGRSTRMGRGKLSLPLGGETILTRSLLALLDADIGLVRVVTSVDAAESDLRLDRFGSRVERMVNPAPEEGMASSLRAGLADLPGEITIIVVALADMPFIEAQTIRTLVGASSDPSTLVTFPVFRSRPGHPVVWDGTVAPELAALRGDRGGKQLVESYVRRGAGKAVAVDDPGVCFDIDTPEDYQRALERLEKMSPPGP